MIKSDPQISRKKISEQLNLSDRKARTAIEHLVAEKKIKREGTDKGGKWIVL